MADAPVVRDLNALIGTIGASVTPLKQQIDSDIAANQQYGDAQVAGLEAKKTRAFGDIEQAAQNKKMFFSGFSPDEQAKYTSDTYLPALAALQQTIAQTRSGLLKEKLGLDKDVFDKAFNTQEADRQVLADWNKMTAQQQFDASESEKQRVFTAQQNQADRNNTASIAAADRNASLAAASIRSSGGGGGGGSSEPSSAQNMAAALSSKTGSDGYVSPGTYSSLKNQWVAGGYGSAGSFDSTFAGYRNPKNTAYKVG